MTEILSQRALNRATLARQYLLDRAPAPVIDAIGHLAGMQSQAPLAPYLGLWTRLRDFAPGELSALTEQRRVVRLHLMRNTVHLVTARDCLNWRTLFYPLHAAGFSAHWRRGSEGVDRDMLVKQAKQLLAERPRTRAELGKLLAGRWPDAEPAALAYAATHHLALCQVPPRGIWGASGPTAWAPVETWLGAPLRSVPVDAVVLRYLGAFGPATVADVQQWSGLTRLREVIERLRPRLRSFRDQAGTELYDLPDAPLPSPDTPAPPRFLPEYDNLLLSHADRSRVNPHRRPVPLPPGSGGRTGTLLADGLFTATWRITRHGQAATLHIGPFGPLPGREAIAAEGMRLLAFAAADATSHDIRFS